MKHKCKTSQSEQHSQPPPGMNREPTLSTGSRLVATNTHGCSLASPFAAADAAPASTGEDCCLASATDACCCFDSEEEAADDKGFPATRCAFCNGATKMHRVRQNLQDRKRVWACLQVE
jgi:hypothetical protein